MNPDNYGGGMYDPTEYDYSGRGAAVSVAMMVVFATLTLVVLKKSGFRAMVAVGPRS